MPVKAANVDDDLIEAVRKRFGAHDADEHAAGWETFVDQYYRWVRAEDLAGRSEDDLLEALRAHWELLQVRKPSETKVHVYNPQAQDGSRPLHTLVDQVVDDMPFLVDTTNMELRRQGYSVDLVIHPVMRVRRDREGRLLAVLEAHEQAEDSAAESILHVEITREPDHEAREHLRENLERVLADVRAAVDDWSEMRARMGELASELERDPPAIEREEVEETRAFLEWVIDDHFTFLGYREYELVHEDDELRLKAIAETGRGILRGTPATPCEVLDEKAAELATAPHLLVLTKANSRSTVHRPSKLDYIGVKHFDRDGQVIGECRFLGLYTQTAYRSSSREIPLLRKKTMEVLARAGFQEASHDAKALLEILEAYPRDPLFQIDADELYEIATGILGLGERQRVRLFARPDPLDRWISCLVTIPRDRYTTEVRERVGRILLEEFGGSELDWTPQLSESVLVRVHYVVYRERGTRHRYDLHEVETRLMAAVRAWSDDLRETLLEDHGEGRGSDLYKRYEHAFPPGYRSDWNARRAVEDIDRIEELNPADSPIVCLYRPEGKSDATARCRLLSADGIALSQVLPTFEHMGTRVIDERPYQISPEGREPVWIYDFGLECGAVEADHARARFEQAFLATWHGELEDDALNGLVLRAELSGREVTILRAVARYLRQVRIAYSDSYMERTLLGHPQIAKSFVELFLARFDPERDEREDAERLMSELEEAIDEVPSLDEDRILRGFDSVLRAITRTSYFRTSEESGPRAADESEAGSEPSYLSFKLDPSKVPILPLPRPQFEIFVYSPRFEGVHLRGGRVARGGLRWSDRPEDFRTEILGLMKAQTVKNALIVPVGSKGGFVLKRTPNEEGEQALREEAVACFKSFLCGMLDLTDNIVDGETVPPERVVRYDEGDPYLVVAADKGTATFSDIANEISLRYRFWLGDAFASGGSHGYDHKQMGITARGAWESVTRHFRELGADVQATDFTVVGIGDMSGDVFGNGMLLSPHIKLVGAFNHSHVFLDPDPDPKTSFEERKRLFEKKRSTWSDYDQSKLSAGGGVFSRSDKSIPISKEVRETLAIDTEQLSPPELIRAMLCAPVDLLWNGGIGTYVKASFESNSDVGDKANDAVRVDAGELRCRVVGEGGNLGFTQLGRIEYALRGGPDRKGGRINTDAIDNVGGVNCSDHEVNIKILLDSLGEGEMDEDQRNELLVEMTDAVAEEVVQGSYSQTQAISLALAQAAPMVDVHARLIRHLERVGGLNRGLEFLPDDEEIEDRKGAKRDLVAPELAVVLAHTKINLYSQLIDSDLPDDRDLEGDLERYFPPPLPERYSEQMHDHRLRGEIIATVIANQVVDRAGSTFMFRLAEETSAPASTLARAFVVARDVFDMASFWEAVQELDNEIAAQTQLAMLIEGRRLVERATRWLVRANRAGINVAPSTLYFRPGAEMLASALPGVLDGADKKAFERNAAKLRQEGVPDELAGRVAGMAAMLSVLDIVAVANATELDARDVTATYFRLGSRLELNWLRDRIIELPRANLWQSLARAALRDDLNTLHRELTQEVLEVAASRGDPEAAIEGWEQQHRDAVRRCLQMIEDVRGSGTFDTTTLPVALREVRNLIRPAASEPQSA